MEWKGTKYITFPFISGSRNLTRLTIFFQPYITAYSQFFICKYESARTNSVGWPLIRDMDEWRKCGQVRLPNKWGEMNGFDQSRYSNQCHKSSNSTEIPIRQAQHVYCAPNKWICSAYIFCYMLLLRIQDMRALIMKYDV